MKDIFLCKSLVDHIAETLGTGLRRKGKAAFLYILYLAHNVQRKGVNTQRRKGNIYCLIPELIDQEVYKFLQFTVVTGA